MKKLCINSMSFKFNQEKNYFFHISSLSFDTGKIYFLEGKNGVGKSTFFSILQGTTPQTTELTGSITFDNTLYIIKNNCMPIAIYSSIKSMLQDANKMIITSMTVAENIRLAQLNRYPSIKIGNYSLALPPFLSHFNINSQTEVAYLSGGQKQILAIIMILQKPTKILLLDEPTAALDEDNSHLVMKFLEEIVIQLDLVIMIITHDKELIDTYKQHPKIIIKKEGEYTRTVSLI